MENIYQINGLPFWDEKAILARRHLEREFALGVSSILREVNPAWVFHEIEAPCLIPADRISPEYTNDNVFFIEKGDDSRFVLRPETTPASYAYAAWLLENQKARPPLVVWQTAKSFRREQDQVTKNMRLKEFYQQEFQCIYSADTMNDYQSVVTPLIANLVEMSVGLPTRVVESDRLPSYSRMTWDVEVENSHKWMELVSISLRTDVPFNARFTTKGKMVEKELLNLEIAIGLDRCVYNRLRLDRAAPEPQHQHESASC